MKNRNLIHSIGILLILTQACVNSKSEKESSIDKDSTKLTKEIKVSSNDDFSHPLNSDLILNKTFYYVTETDSGDIVIDWNDFGINGVKYMSDKLQYMGSGPIKANIDSIRNNKEYLTIYWSYEINNKTIEQNYEIEPVINKPNYVRIRNTNTIMIDSVYSEKIPIIKQSRYDQ